MKGSAFTGTFGFVEEELGVYLEAPVNGSTKSLPAGTLFACWLFFKIKSTT